jgi:hypothetical protein
MINNGTILLQVKDMMLIIVKHLRVKNLNRDLICSKGNELIIIQCKNGLHLNVSLRNIYFIFSELRFNINKII